MTDNDVNAAIHEAQLEELATGAGISRVLSFYDALSPVTVDDMIGEWRGSGLHTGHPFDGLLERFGWYGKRFRGSEDVDPLLFSSSKGDVFTLNPTMMPINLIQKHPSLLRHDAVSAFFKLGGKLLITKKPQARLRMTEYRGVVTATMIYDCLPINDVFRSVSNDVRVGAMDIRGSRDPFMFVLRRSG